MTIIILLSNYRRGQRLIINFQFNSSSNVNESNHSINHKLRSIYPLSHQYQFQFNDEPACFLMTELVKVRVFGLELR